MCFPIISKNFLFRFVFLPVPPYCPGDIDLLFYILVTKSLQPVVHHVLTLETLFPLLGVLMGCKDRLSWKTCRHVSPHWVRLFPPWRLNVPLPSSKVPSVLSTLNISFRVIFEVSDLFKVFKRVPSVLQTLTYDSTVALYVFRSVSCWPCDIRLFKGLECVPTLSKFNTGRSPLSGVTCRSLRSPLVSFQCGIVVSIYSVSHFRWDLDWIVSKLCSKIFWFDQSFIELTASLLFFIFWGIFRVLDRELLLLLLFWLKYYRS